MIEFMRFGLCKAQIFVWVIWSLYLAHSKREFAYNKAESSVERARLYMENTVCAATFRNKNACLAKCQILVYIIYREACTTVMNLRDIIVAAMYNYGSFINYSKTQHTSNGILL